MRYDKEFKEQALELSDEIGVRNAASQLGIQLYTGRAEKRQKAFTVQRDRTDE